MRSMRYNIDDQLRPHIHWDHEWLRYEGLPLLRQKMLGGLLVKDLELFDETDKQFFLSLRQVSETLESFLVALTGEEE